MASAGLFARVPTIEQIPTEVTRLLLGVSIDPIVRLFVVGMFMESIAAIQILASNLVPGLALAGVAPVHRGVVVVLDPMIGLLTPPVGMSIRMVSCLTGVPVERVIRSTLPCHIPLLAALIVITLVPAPSTWLPGLAFRWQVAEIGGSPTASGVLLSGRN